MGNLISECYVIYIVEGGVTRIIPTIHLSKPVIRTDQRYEKYENVFEAKKAIKVFVGEWMVVRIAG
jgi:hypothetical protein